MNYVGVSAGFHDAAVSVVDSNGDILFAGHSERYSGAKHDAQLCSGLVDDALGHATSAHTEIHYYETPWKKVLRQIRSGEDWRLRNTSSRNIIGEYFGDGSITNHSHHLSHAAAGFQTSPFSRATIVVIDSIGEFDTISIWGGEYINSIAQYKKLWSKQYPDSIGLYYSAMTQRVGLRPLDEEYILMGMAAYGRDHLVPQIENYLLSNIDHISLKKNLHTGVDQEWLRDFSDYDIAASSQTIVEKLIFSVMKRAKELNFSENLVYMGGVALNCLANRNLGDYFDKIWIMPNPGDAGSSLGAAALGYKRKLNWQSAYLGHNIPGKYPVTDIVSHLLTHKICGVASGRAEFGPRALGNRSLLADPRGAEIKDKVNEIKRRQKFRPFAPVILEEHVNDFFDMPRGWVDSRYMQIVANCKEPLLYPAIVHHDGTSRVQTVPKDGSGIRQLLEEWFNQTGCPMLLNTSLNIRGEPMVNDRADADRFEREYNVAVYS